MSNNNQTVGVGGLVRHGDSFLVVKHSYGPTKGIWDFPRGYVEENEALHAAILREIGEETKVNVKPLKIIALRDMLSIYPSKKTESNLLVIWLLEYIEGVPTADNYELLDAKFMTTYDILNSPEVCDWAKEMVQIALKDEGLAESKFMPESTIYGTTYWKLYSI